MRKRADTILLGILAFTLLLGQWGRIDIARGITVYSFDIVLLSMFIVAAVRKKQKSAIATANGLIIVIFFISLAGNYWRLSYFEAIHSGLYILRYILYGGMFFFVRQNDTYPWLKSVMYFGVLYSVFGLIQLLLLPDMRLFTSLGFDPHYYRLVGPIFDPNYSGILIAATLAVTFTRADVEKKKKTVFVLIQLSALFLTYSRGALLAFFAAIIVYSLVKRSLLFFSGFLLAITIFIAVPKINIISLDLLRMETVYARIDNFATGLRYFSESPVIGVGYNTLPYTVALSTSLETVIPSRALSGFDNSYLFILVTSGFAGFFLFLYLFYVIGTMIRSVYGDDTGNGLPIAVGVCVVLVGSITINAFFYPHILILFWILTGVGENVLAKKS